MKSSKRTSRGNSVWLVTWEYQGEHAKPATKFAAVLSPHWSGERVREIVELHYVNDSYSLSERLGYAVNRRFNPYPAEFSAINGVRWQGRITCGHNPFLLARLVDNFRVVASDGRDSATWTERTVPNFDRAPAIDGDSVDEPIPA